MIILYVIIAVVFFGIGYTVKHFQKIEIIEHNREIEKENKALLDNLDVLSSMRLSTLEEIKDLQNKLYTIRESYQNEKEMTDHALHKHYQDAETELIEKYNQAQEQCKENYLTILKEASQDYLKLIQEKSLELESVQIELDKAESIQAAIIKNFKEEAKKQDEINYFKIIIPDSSLRDIEKIRTIIPQLSNKEVLNKLIWKTYYEKPFSDLIGRLFNKDKVCGIYKITNLKNHMSYIGQSVNIKDRFRQHVKRGLGADVRTKNKIYLAMEQFGVENFSFQILEECPREQLNEKEKYWINFYKTQEFGYNETKGNE